MLQLVAQSINQHRAMEHSLDALIAALRAGSAFTEIFPEAARLAIAHYAAEEPLLNHLARIEPAVAAKLAAQHDEALEIAARLEEAVAAGQAADALALARRFHAIAQHNIIEEERDVFPLMKR